MRILLDKNVPEPLRLYLAEYVVRTAAEQGWDRLTNGALLAAAEQEGFDLLITADQNLSSQNNMTGRKLAVIVLGTNRWSLLKTEPERLRESVRTATTGSVQKVSYPLPPKQRS